MGETHGLVVSTVGIDNVYQHAETSYLNPVIQMLYSIPTVRLAALAAQCNEYHHRCLEYNQKGIPVITQTPSFLCEMGFVFHMMREVMREQRERTTTASSDNDVEDWNIILPTRLQQVFSTCEEVVTLGLVPSRNTTEVVS